MRRVIKAKALGNPTCDISALATPESVDAILLIKLAEISFLFFLVSRVPASLLHSCHHSCRWISKL